MTCGDPVTVRQSFVLARDGSMIHLVRTAARTDRSYGARLQRRKVT
jgi:hypothetical protein